MLASSCKCPLCDLSNIGALASTNCGLRAAAVAVADAAGIITAHIIVLVPRLCWLYPRAATLKTSQRGYSRLGATKAYVQMPQQWRVYREAIHGLTPSQLVMSKCHNIEEITERPFTTWGHHSFYVQRAQHWRDHREAIHVLGLWQFMSENHNNQEIIEWVFMACGQHSLLKWSVRMFMAWGHHIYVQWPQH